MKKKIFIPIGVLIVLLSFSFYGQKADNVRNMKYQPEKGMVSDSSTAIKIAEAILVPIYGQKEIDGERPLKAKLIKDGTVWAVSGSLPPSGISVDKNGDSVYTVVMGGVAYIEIQKSDCKVVYLEHGK